MGNTWSDEIFPGNVGTGDTVPDGEEVVVQPAASSKQTVMTRIAMVFTFSRSYGDNCAIKVKHSGKKSL
jgi:hypothetical protein